MLPEILGTELAGLGGFTVTTTLDLFETALPLARTLEAGLDVLGRDKVVLQQEVDRVRAVTVDIDAGAAFDRLGRAVTLRRGRPFDDAADGFVPGEGVGAVVLKPLSAALADGDPVYGVLVGSGINQGRGNLGLAECRRVEMDGWSSGCFLREES